MTLEEIGRRAVALTDARVAVEKCEERYVGCEDLYDPDVAPPCWHEKEDPDEWCGPCRRHADQVAARQRAGHRLSSAVRAYRRARNEKPGFERGVTSFRCRHCGAGAVLIIEGGGLPWCRGWLRCNGCGREGFESGDTSAWKPAACEGN